MLKKLALTFVSVFAVLGAALLLYTSQQPDTFRVERSLFIQASPAKVQALVDDFHQWSRWSPWSQLDPKMQTRFSGAARGVGAVYAWEGNKKVGSGRMEITALTPGQRVQIDLQFTAPHASRNTVEVLLQPQGDGVLVTQAMAGKNLWIGKVMGLFFSMDQMIGSKYEQGLATLKTLAEAP